MVGVEDAWPAFWLTGADIWPPESDILGYKGDTRNWFNIYWNASGGWSNTTVNVPSPGSWGRPPPRTPLPSRNLHVGRIRTW